MNKITIPKLRKIELLINLYNKKVVNIKTGKKIRMIDKKTLFEEIRSILK